MTTIHAEPYDIDIDLARTALIIIDMQRDFAEPGGFGEALGNDTSPLQAVIPPTQRVLAAARDAGLLVVHTREGHRADLTDLWSAKHGRGEGDDVLRIGDAGPMGRLLVRGERGHDIVPELAPRDGEPIIDKPGKGSFYATDLEVILRRHDVATLIVCGVTTEVCVHTTVREANDRGFDAVVLSDCVGSYFPEFQRVGLEMIKAQGGIFGWVAASESFLDIVDKK
ncbi:MAG: cysteine hydrolase family protein [Acidimicrobiales bacterium]